MTTDHPAVGMCAQKSHGAGPSGECLGRWAGFRGRGAHVCASLEALGFLVHHRVLNAADYGLPQQRHPPTSPGVMLYLIGKWEVRKRE